jgi:hypothetical protein
LHIDDIICPSKYENKFSGSKPIALNMFLIDFYLC